MFIYKKNIKYTVRKRVNSNGMMQFYWIYKSQVPNINPCTLILIFKDLTES